MNAYTIAHLGIMHGLIYLGVLLCCFLFVAGLLYAAALINHYCQHDRPRRPMEPESLEDDPAA